MAVYHVPNHNNADPNGPTARKTYTFYYGEVEKTASPLFLYT